jgi:NitT/TauT family transport system substrate-binding protein
VSAANPLPGFAATMTESQEIIMYGCSSSLLKKLMIGAMAVATLGLAYAAPAAAEDLTKIKISVDYRLYGPNAPLWYAQSSGLFRKAGIEATVDGSSGSGDAIARVASGAYDAAYADVGTLAEFWARNPRVAPKLVMTILDRSPQSIVSLKKKNITKLSDLVGRKVGTGKVDATSRMFPAVLKINNVPIDKVDILPIDQKLRDAMFVRGDVDAVIGFDSAILFNLMTQNIQPSDTNVIYYADNGFNFYGNGLVVSQALIAKNPDLVRRLTKAVAQAWVASVKEPKAVIDALAQRDSMTDVPMETRRLQWIIEKSLITPATRANGVGAMDLEKLNGGLKKIAEGFGLSATPTAADIYDDRFLPPIEDRTLPK